MAASVVVDAGFLVALLSRRDFHHAWAVAQVPLNIAGRGLVPGLQAGWLDAARGELEETRLGALEVIGGAWLKTMLFIVIAPLIGMGLAYLLMLAVYWIFRKAHPEIVEAIASAPTTVAAE